MSIRTSVLCVALAIAGCSSGSSPPSPKGQVVVALTIDWEGAYMSPEGLEALDSVRQHLRTAPLTHFISAAYFTKAEPDATAAASITKAVRPGDEVAMHLHGWQSLAAASGIEPRLSPSFLTGTDKLLALEGDIGFDIDLDAYGVPELRAMLRTSRRLLEAAQLRVSKSFRAGGYLGTPKVLQAIHDEGYAVDSSATDYRQLDEPEAEVLPRRLAAIWPKIDASTQPFVIDTRGGQLLEMPIAAFADYATAAEIVALVEAAHARLQQAPRRDVFVVLGFHQETAGEFGGRLGEALQQLHARPELARALVFTTVEAAAIRARATLAPAPAK